MNIATKKQNLIDRLMKVGAEKTLDSVDAVLVQAEMVARAEESMEAIRKGNVISLEQFSKNTKEWLKARRVTK